jgi:hypothetical protein
MRVPSPALGRTKIIIWLIKEIDNRNIPGNAASRPHLLSCPHPGWPPPELDQVDKNLLRSPSLELRLEVFRRIVRYNPVGYKLFCTQNPLPGGPAPGLYLAAGATYRDLGGGGETPETLCPSPDGSSGRNPEVNFHGERRLNQTHASTTDPEARLFRKGKD